MKRLYQPVFRYTFKYCACDDNLITLYSNTVYTDPAKAAKCAQDLWSLIKGKDDILKEILIKEIHVSL